MPIPTTEEQRTEEKEFDEAFDDIFDEKNPEAKNKDPEQDPKPKDPADDKSDNPPEPETPPAAADPSATPPAASGSDEPPAQADPGKQQQDPDYKALYEKEQQRTKSWEGRITAANRKAEEAEARIKLLEEELAALRTVDTPADPEASPIEEDEEYKQFQQDFPDVAGPVEQLVKAEVGKVKEKLTKKEKEEQKKQEEDEEEARKQFIKEHFDTIGKSHPDYQEIFDNPKLPTWIEEQPPIVRAGLQAVVQHGTAEEVIALIDDFKEFLGVSKTKDEASDPTTQNPTKKTNDLEKMVAVDPATTKIDGTVKKNMDDFDSAWDEAPE